MVGKDKVEHFIVTFFGTLLTGLMYKIIIGVFAAGIVSIAKEIYDDKIKKEKIDVWDLTADCGGIICGVLIFLIYYY